VRPALGRGPLVGGEQPRDLRLPAQRAPQPPGAELPHPGLLLGIVDEFDNALAERGRVIARRVQARIAGGDAPLVQVELDYRLGECHVFHDLVHRGDIVHPVGLVRVDADVRGREHGAEILI
jgi:hypothetical protein